MLFRSMSLLLLLFVTGFVKAQVLPAPGAKLNYTQIMFEHGKVYGAEEYIIQVAFKSSTNTFNGPVMVGKDSATAVMLSNFEFGKRYIWRYAGLHNGKNLGWNGPYYFETLMNSYVDTDLYRLIVVKPDTDVKTTGLVLLDAARTIVDRKGNFVWFLPENGAVNTSEDEINDLRLTPAGTLTFLKGRKAIETNLNGDSLWQAPKEIDTESRRINNVPLLYNYNHCFMRLANGNYMVQTKINGPPPRVDTATVSSPVANNANHALGMQYDIIKEFDKKCNLIWSWNSKDYFTPEEEKIMLAAKPDPGILTKEPGGHLNAFDVDEKNGYVFAGFRNISRVVKIDMKTKTALNSWGLKMRSGGADEGDGFFSKQHDVTLLADGSIAVFSNGTLPPVNSGIAKEPSKVVLFSQPADRSASKIIWQYDCIFDNEVLHSTRGGSVNGMKNGNLLVCMGTVSRVFEITRSKKIVWQVQVAKYAGKISMWVARPLYKAHYCSSLYPCYFTVQAEYDTLTEKSPAVKLRIFNVGSENDSYVIKVSSADGNYKSEISTASVQNGISANFEIRPGAIPKSSENVVVSVTSKTNPDFVRTITLRFLNGGHHHER